ncbi:MAG: S-layer homology domain-containing protein [Clostridiales bacterium]|nr:S-layer homology domain-containing protein [Clostridiales bacterium]
MKHRSRMMALLLAMALLIGMMPIAVFAEDEEMIEEVSLNFKEPSAGDDIASYINNCVITIPDDAEYTVQGIQFLDAKNKEPVSGKFENKDYACTITLQANEGYTFKYEADDEDEEYYIWDIYVNDELAKYGLLKSDQIMEVFFNIAIGSKPMGGGEEVKEVKTIVLDFPEPKAGQTVASVGKGRVYGDPEGSLVEHEFNIVWYESKNDDFSFVTDETFSDFMSDTDTFKAGYYYGVASYTITTDPAEGYTLPKGTPRKLSEGERYDNDFVWKVFGPLKGTEAKTVADIFKDVPSGAWYEKFLQKAYDNEIIAGTSATTYAPAANLNHGQIMVMAANLHSKQKQDNYDFQANKKAGAAWYQVFEDYCKAEGIIDDRFDGKETKNVTREEMAYYFANTLTNDSYKDKKSVELNDIAGNPYETEITKLAKADIVGGKGAGKYDPSGLINRAEAAVFISNILDAME